MEYLELTVFPKKYIAFTVVDFIIRTVLFLWYLYYDVNIWVFIGIQIGIFVGEGIIYSIIESKYKAWINQQLSSDLKDKFVIKVTNDIPGPTVLFYGIAGLVVTYVILNDIVEPESWYAYLLIVIAVIFFSIFFMIAGLINHFPKKRTLIKYRVFKVVDKRQSRSRKEILDYTDISSEYKNILRLTERPDDFQIVLDSSDENDAKIAKLESQLKSINTKVDAYMLESVLLGALAFSGFLTIIVSTIITDKEERFTEIKNSLFRLGSDTVSGMELINTGMNKLISDEYLFIILMFESLVSSVFFILVLALRLRYSDLSLKLDYLIRIMNIFNAKEEELVNYKLTSGQTNDAIEGRLDRLSDKINIASTDAEQLYNEIRPIVGIMGLLRNVGIFSFYILLATSGLYFSLTVALSILSLALLTVIFRIVERSIKTQRIRSLLKYH